MSSLVGKGLMCMGYNHQSAVHELALFPGQPDAVHV